jgi:predicted methyltransferase
MAESRINCASVSMELYDDNEGPSRIVTFKPGEAFYPALREMLRAHVAEVEAEYAAEQVVGKPTDNLFFAQEKADNAGSGVA